MINRGNLDTFARRMGAAYGRAEGHGIHPWVSAADDAAFQAGVNYLDGRVGAELAPVDILAECQQGRVRVGAQPE